MTCSDSGWMVGDRFVQWMQHFVQCVNQVQIKSCCLFWTVTNLTQKNLKAIEIAIDNNVLMLSLPRHTTHKTQPLDRAFFKQLQTFYDQAVERWLRKNPGRSFISYQIAKLFVKLM